MKRTRGSRTTIILVLAVSRGSRGRRAGAGAGRIQRSSRGDSGAARDALGGDKRIASTQTISATGTDAVQYRATTFVPIEFEISIELPDKYVRTDEIPCARERTDQQRIQRRRADSAWRIFPKGAVGDAVVRPLPADSGQQTLACEAGLCAAGARHVRDIFQRVSAHVRVCRPGRGAGGQGRRHRREGRRWVRRTAVHRQQDTCAADVELDHSAEPRAGRGGSRGHRRTCRPDRSCSKRRRRPDPRPRRNSSSNSSRMRWRLDSKAMASARPTENRIYYADYRDVDGLKLPFRIRRAVGATTTEETTFDRFRINAKIDPRKFEAAQVSGSRPRGPRWRSVAAGRGAGVRAAVARDADARSRSSIRRTP